MRRGQHHTIGIAGQYIERELHSITRLLLACSNERLADLRGTLTLEVVAKSSDFHKLKSGLPERRQLLRRLISTNM
jgi:hypothetical protein